MWQVSKKCLHPLSLGNVKLSVVSLHPRHPSHSSGRSCACAEQFQETSLANVGESGSNTALQSRAGSWNESEQSVLAS